VVGKCSLKTREAVLGNLLMDSLEERRAVSKEIIDYTLHYLHGVFGSDNPSNSMLLCVPKLLCVHRKEKWSESCQSSCKCLPCYVQV
jgi:hypothetical protein